MQSKIWSLVEAWINVLIGFWVAVLAQMTIYPYFGIETTFGDNVNIALFFTAISIARSYVVRRAFNWFHTHVV